MPEEIAAALQVLREEGDVQGALGAKSGRDLLMGVEEKVQKKLGESMGIETEKPFEYHFCPHCESVTYSRKARLCPVCKDCMTEAVKE